MLSLTTISDAFTSLIRLFDTLLSCDLCPCEQGPIKPKDSREDEWKYCVPEHLSDNGEVDGCCRLAIGQFHSFSQSIAD